MMTMKSVSSLERGSVRRREAHHHLALVGELDLVDFAVDALAGGQEALFHVGGLALPLQVRAELLPLAGPFGAVAERVRGRCLRRRGGAFRCGSLRCGAAGRCRERHACEENRQEEDAFHLLAVLEVEGHAEPD